MNHTEQIVTFQESPHTEPHYHLRGCGPLRPLTVDQARVARRFGVPIDLPETAVLRPAGQEIKQ